MCLNECLMWWKDWWVWWLFLFLILFLPSSSCPSAVYIHMSCGHSSSHESRSFIHQAVQWPFSYVRCQIITKLRSISRIGKSVLPWRWITWLLNSCWETQQLIHKCRQSPPRRCHVTVEHRLGNSTVNSQMQTAVAAAPPRHYRHE